MGNNVLLDMLSVVRIPRTLFPALWLMVLLSGCHESSTPVSSPSITAAQQQMDLMRQQMDLIPPPSKTRYMAIRTLSSWENPYITVEADALILHVLLADANPSSLGVGGMTRPISARRQDLTISVNDLPAALSSVPQNAWPYGRVIALEEAHNAPTKAQPAVRRTMETVMQRLNNLGVVVYEWSETGNAH